MANDRRRRGGYGFGVNLTGPGTVITLGFIALAIGMGVLLSRGITPKHILTDPGETDAELEVEEDTTLGGQKGLQLKTIKFKECASTVTVDFMLDKSSSMGRYTPSGVTKLARLKDAVNSFLEKANDTSVVGIQSFYSTPNGLVPVITNDVPISYYKDVKGLIPSVLASYSAIGATPTHGALTYAYNVLKDGLPKFPDREFNFIFISDGAPCPGIDCPTAGGADQDPRLFTPNPADEIKKLGVTVYTLGIYEAGQRNLPFLEELLKSIATSPDHYYAATTADDTKRLLSQISTRICNSSVSPTP